MGSPARRSFPADISPRVGCPFRGPRLRPSRHERSGSVFPIAVSADDAMDEADTTKESVKVNKPAPAKK